MPLSYEDLDAICRHLRHSRRPCARAGLASPSACDRITTAAPELARTYRHFLGASPPPAGASPPPAGAAGSAAGASGAAGAAPDEGGAAEPAASLGEAGDGFDEPQATAAMAIARPATPAIIARGFMGSPIVPAWRRAGVTVRSAWVFRVRRLQPRPEYGMPVSGALNKRTADSFLRPQRNSRSKCGAQ